MNDDGVICLCVLMKREEKREREKKKTEKMEKTREKKRQKRDTVNYS